MTIFIPVFFAALHWPNKIFVPVTGTVPLIKPNIKNDLAHIKGALK